MFCPDCGAEVAEGRKFCGKCGGRLHAGPDGSSEPMSTPNAPGTPAQMKAPVRPASPRRKLVYALIALLAVLGGVAWWWFHRPAPAYRAKDPGIYPFQDQGKWGFIDAKGDVLIQPEYDEVGLNLIQGQWVFFTEGLCATKANGKWGYIDKKGSFIIPAQFDHARPFVSGVAAVALGNQWGFIDKNGHYVINPQFENASDFYGGLAPAEKDGEWGFIDKSSRFVIPAKFGEVNPSGFVDGLAGVQINQHVGYIDRSGKLAISTNFQEIDDFSEGLARVRLGNRWGYIDTSGKLVINPQFDQALNFSGGKAVVSVAGHWGTIDKTGKFILNPGQYNIPGFAGNLLVVSANDGLGFMTRDGMWVLQPSKAINGFWWPVIGNVLYVSLTTQGVTPISTSGKVLAGWYKGAMWDTLAQDIQNETTAINSLRNLMNAESSYSAAYPTSGFTDSLGKLGPASGTPNEDHANLIDAALASGAKDNYQFTVSIPAGTSVAGANFNYFILAKPAAGHFGRSLCADSSGTIHYGVQGGTCTTSSPTVAIDESPSGGGNLAWTLPLTSSLWRDYVYINGQWALQTPHPPLFAKVSDGLRFNGVGYRGSVAAFSVTAIPLTSSTVRFRWKLNGAGGYMGFQPNLVFFDAPPSDPSSLKALPLSTHAFTTDHSWDNSYCIQDNTWYYTTLSVQENTLLCATAESNYSDRGGRVIDQITASATGSAARFGHLWLNIMDFYQGDAVSLTVGDWEVS